MVRLTSRRGKYNSSLHPRGVGGRFVATPDAPKKAKRRRKRDNNAKDTLKTLTLEAKTAKRVRDEKLRVLAEMDAKDRRKVLRGIAKVAAVAPKSIPEAPVSPAKGKGKAKTPKKDKDSPEARLEALNKQIDKATKAAEKKYKGRIKDLKKDTDARKLARRVQRAKEKGKPVPYSPWNDKEIKVILGQESSNPRKERERPPVSRESFKIAMAEGGKAKVNLWEGTDHGKYKGGFKEKVDRNFKYEVFHDGKPVELNKGFRVMEYEGEKVKGVPSMNARLRELPTEKLVGDLAINMKYVEAWDKSKVAAPAPRWDVTHMGGKVDPSLVAKAGYGGMELHHIGQWTKTPFDKVSRDLEAGKISLDEAKGMMKEMLRPNPNITSGYEIACAPKGQREYVVLPAGTHNATSPLYRANHPLGVHPDTGKPAEFGIPSKAKGSDFGLTEGREYHDGIRDGFWSEYRRRESLVLAGELTRRLSKGETTPDELEQAWAEAVGRQEKGSKESRKGTNLS